MRSKKWTYIIHISAWLLFFSLPFALRFVLPNDPRKNLPPPPNLFCRVHRSYIIALQKIEKIARKHIVIGKKEIPIGDSFSEAFFTILR